MAEFDLARVKGNDRYIAGGSLVILVLSFLPWYAVSISGSLGALVAPFGRDGSVSAWHAYGLNKLGIVLALAAGALVIARLMGALDEVALPAGVNLITLALSGLATAIFLLRLIDAYHSEGTGGFTVSAHPGWAWYLSILVSAAMTYFAFLSFRASGEQLPTAASGYPPPPAPPEPGTPPS